MELTVQNVYGLLLRSKLLPLEEARAMFARWQEESRENFGNLVKFASWMVANRYLTEYQASLLARGHADNFFLGDYKVLDRLGKGRMAGVYKAQHQLGQVVALKVLPPSKSKDHMLRGRFLREARLAMKLKHPNIVRTFEVGVAGELHYLVMEYLEGDTLQEVLQRRGKLPPAEAVRLIFQALQGLQHIHEKQLVHRDLKPSNLMLVNPPGVTGDSTLRATVKILDIGLGRSLFGSDPVDKALDQGLTGEGVVLGTPDYMAPEQARDPRTTDIRADIYSLGCVLYHLIAGQPPFPDTNFISQMIRHATEQARPLKEFNPAVPDGLQQIVNWMMAKDPNGRYPTPERAAQALQMFLAAGSDPAIDPTADPRMSTYLKYLEANKRDQPPPKGSRKRERGAPGPTVPAVAVPPLAGAAPPQAGGQAAAPQQPGKPGTGTAIPVPGSKPPTRKVKSLRAAQKRHKKKRLAAAPPPIPGAAPTAVPAPVPAAVDVELVPVAGGPTPAAPPGRRLNRRDMIIFGVGAAAGALASFIGCLFALRGK
jgi:serine/threonine protein kinase